MYQNWSIHLPFSIMEVCAEPYMSKGLWVWRLDSLIFNGYDIQYNCTVKRYLLCPDLLDSLAS